MHRSRTPSALPTSLLHSASATDRVLALQRIAGNRAVTAMIQTKLTVGAADDPYEREADHVARQVIAAPSPTGAMVREENKGDVAQRKVTSPITPITLAQRASKGEGQDLSGSFEAGAEVEHTLSASHSGGNPLPAHLRADLEPKFSVDFGKVRVHTGAESDRLNRQLGAQAFTHGSHIYMAAGKYSPGTGAGKQLLAHELTHVVQQGGAAAGKAQRSPVRIQRAVAMYESLNDARSASKGQQITGKETILKDAGSAFAQVEQELQGVATYTKEERAAMKAKLAEWIKKDASMAPSMAWFKRAMTSGTGLNTGRAQNKKYASYQELGLALLGHIRSRKHKKTESNLAAKTKKSSYIKGKLQEVQRAIYTMVENIQDNAAKANFWSGMGGAKQYKGEYLHWYKNIKNVKAMLQHGTGDFKQAIASIHDAGTVMLKISGAGNTKKDLIAKGAIDTWGAGDNFMGTVEKDDGKGGKTTTREKISSTYRANSTAVNEKDDWVKTARAHGALLWAGPSHTTSNMMVMMKGLIERVPALTNKHTEAVAWAIFAFWNKDFLSFKDGYHTFHEVMDIASQFGVPYTPFQYPTDPPGGATTTAKDVEEPQWQENPLSNVGWNKNPLFQS